MALEAVDLVVNDDALLELFQIPQYFRKAVKTSWQHGQPDFQGRFDFSWSLKTDGEDNMTTPISGKNWQPKMLEYNADTPSLQLESGVISRDWFQQKYPEQAKSGAWHQSNYLDAAANNAM